MKRISKSQRYNLPVFNVIKAKPNYVFQLLARIVLICFAAFGICLTVAQTYKLPVETADIAAFSLLTAFILCLLFAVLKFRFSLPLIAAAVFLLLEKELFFDYLNNFLNYFAYFLDSRLIYTSLYATLERNEIDSEKVAAAAFCLFFLICFVCALSSRAKFIGTILITEIILLVPAFASETALFYSGFYPLIAAMAGLYGMWLAHELTPVNKFAKKRGFLKHILADAPYVNSNAAQGVFLALVCAASLAVSGIVVPGETTGLSSFVLGLQQDIVNAATNISAYLNAGSGIEHNGYFAERSLNDSSNMVHLNAPSSSARPVLTVKKSDNTAPLYLRGTICIDYNSAARGWTTANDSRELGELNELIKGFYPEVEYMLYAQRVRPFFADYGDFLDIQDVYLDYLLNTKVILTPPSIYLPNYKDNPQIEFSLDTVLRSKQIMNTDYFSTFFIKKTTPYFSNAWEIANLSIISEYASDDDSLLITEYSDYSTGISLNALNITPSEYLQNKGRYEDLINKIYTGVSDGEQENIARLKDEIAEYNDISYAQTTNIQNYGNGAFIRNRYSKSTGNKLDKYEPLSLQPWDAYRYSMNLYDYVDEMTRYFNSGEYRYSLITNNLSGDNTMLGNFLFRTKSGHCALYATALTLLLRSDGIPARYVTGYAVNTGGVQVENGLYQYTVLERDLHAWVEVYFENLGWVAFDPTPAITQSVFAEAQNAEAVTAQGEETQPPPEETENAQTAAEQTETESVQTQAQELGGNKKLPSAKMIATLAATVIVVTLATLLILYFLSLERKEKALLKKFSAISTRKTAKKAADFIMLIWKCEAFSVNAGELPEDFAVRVDESIELFNTAGAQSVIAVIEKLEFSKEYLTDGQFALLSRYLNELYKYAVLSRKPVKRLIKRFMIIGRF